MAGRIRKLILKNFQSPGDIVMMTAAVRDLHHCHPGRFITDVRTACDDLWLNNPHITPIDESDIEAESIRCEYPLIHQSNQRPFHFIHGFHKFLSKKLGVAFEPLEFRGDIHLTDDERQMPEHLVALLGDGPFWIVVAGGKFDFTIKWWSPERWQSVVDQVRGRVRFAQVGGGEHHHPALDGVADLRGKTTVRELIRLIHHAEGVICPVTLAMHLAAAVPPAEGNRPVRPCVVVAGGREPAHWEAYPGHQFLHTIGALPCCATGGCWRSRTLPIDDSDSKNNESSLCKEVVGSLPRCMDMITPEHVVRTIDLFEPSPGVETPFI